MSDDVVVDELRDPGIALLTLNRPARLNAWNGELAVRYFRTARQGWVQALMCDIRFAAAGAKFTAAFSELMTASLTRADFKEGVARFLQKRTPDVQPVQDA
jgi:enoyl-CoA hydratase/carnithine racemase